MKIAAFINESLIDYPGKLASVIFTQGCNFRCGYCHNPQLVLPWLYKKYNLIDEHEVLTQLQERTNWIDGVVITGGEPTLQTDLSKFLKKIKSMGYLIKIDTNGSNPEVIENLIKGNLIDFISVDIKSNLEAQSYSSIIGVDATTYMHKIQATLQLIIKSQINAEIRTVIIPGHHTAEMIHKIRSYAPTISHTITHFRSTDIVENYL